MFNFDVVTKMFGHLTKTVFKITNDNAEEMVARGDEIIKLPDGSLTTMYHYVKNSSLEIEEILTSKKFENIDS